MFWSLKKEHRERITEKLDQKRVEANKLLIARGGEFGSDEFCKFQRLKSCDFNMLTSTKNVGECSGSKATNKAKSVDPFSITEVHCECQVMTKKLVLLRDKSKDEEDREGEKQIRG